MLNKLFGLFSLDIAIDLGTANTLVYSKKGEVLLNEPSVVSIRQESKGQKVIAAVGGAAKKMLGRTPGNITTIRPMKDGVIADFVATEKMLKEFIRQAHGSRMFRPAPRVLVCVPAKATEVEKKAIRESAYTAGAREVFLIEEPMAAAIGAGLPVADARASMIVDIGGGTSEIAVISLNGIVYSESVRVAGDKIDDAIVQYVRRNLGIVIGETTAEQIKHDLGYAEIIGEVEPRNYTGRHLADGVPRTFALTAHQVNEAIQEPISHITSGVMRALENAPPELASDISADGMYLTGGGALIKGLDRLLASKTGVPVHIADNPLTCVAKGGAKALDLIDSLELS